MKDSTYRKYCLVVDEWLVNGFNGVKAYQSIYPNSSYNNADKSFRVIHEIPRIKEYIKEKQQNKSDELNITLTSQLKALADIIVAADKESDKINAIKEQNKLLALYKEHNGQKVLTPLTSLIIKTVGKDS
jgi:phage terminase small subunit